MDPQQQNDIEALEYFGFASDERSAAAWIRVPGIVEATVTTLFDVDGTEVVLASRRGQMLGTLADEDSAVVKQRPGLWTPLKLPISYMAEEKRPRR